ncbi:MAG: hypothetical protein U0939_05255 [Pirellulales bacterium]
MSDLAIALRPVIAELNRRGVLYYVGGSIASSFHGAGRSTMDVDVATELDESAAVDLVKSLSREYYGSEVAACNAVRRRSCFNLIHLGTSLKIDIFISQGRDFDRSVLRRTITESLGGSEPITARIASAEDIILIKLEWYRLGGEISERQWSDVTRVARLYGPRLDREYLQHWSSQLGVHDLLVRLLLDVDSPPP